MISTLLLFIPHAAMWRGTGVLALSPALQTNLILVATLLFLVFASWAMLMTARPTHGTGDAPPVSEFPARPARSGPSSRALAVFIGLMSSLGLLALCAF